MSIDDLIAKAKAAQAVEEETSPEQEQQKKFLEFEEERQMMGATNRMFPNWKGDQEMEPWFQNRDEITHYDIIPLIEKKNLPASANWITSLVVDNVINQLSEDSSGDLEVQTNLASQLFLISRRAKARIPRKDGELMDPSDYTCWLFRCIDQTDLSVSDTLKWVWRVVELEEELWSRMVDESYSRLTTEAVDNPKKIINFILYCTNAATECMMIKNMLHDTLAFHEDYLFPA